MEHNIYISLTFYLKATKIWVYLNAVKFHILLDLHMFCLMFVVAISRKCINVSLGSTGSLVPARIFHARFQRIE